MSLSQLNLNKYKEAKEFVDKAMELELENGSEISLRYDAIKEHQQLVSALYKQYLEENPPKKSLLNSLAPDSGVKISIYAASAALVTGVLVWYLRKK
mmetsp:Transcript_6062/g.5216  ORF Transcript_6062/g.5216 Transcript_6062/m.5216 type:complete len:97 (+) Transcript_6062:841-1131(+)